LESFENWDNRKLKIVGIFVVKNEWPLLALSISHALINNCDEVIVIDKGSSDSSVAGMRKLQKLFPDRLHIFEYLGPFYQAAIVGAGIRIAREIDADYCLALDADEFLVMKSGISLKEYITQKMLDSDYTSIRVRVENFVVPRKFNEHNLMDFAAINFRANPTQNQISASPSDLIRMITSNEIGILENHFWNFKVILKMSDSAFVTPGNHQTTKAAPIYFASQEEIVWAHVPYRRASRVIRRNWPEGGKRAGVHYKLLEALAIGKTDDELWSLVSLDENNQNPRIPLSEDSSLSSSLLPIIEQLFPIWDDISSVLTEDEFSSNAYSQTENRLLSALVDMVNLHLGKDFTDQVQIT